VTVLKSGFIVTNSDHTMQLKIAVTSKQIHSHSVRLQLLLCVERPHNELLVSHFTHDL